MTWADPVVTWADAAGVWADLAGGLPPAPGDTGPLKVLVIGDDLAWQFAGSRDIYDYTASVAPGGIVPSPAGLSALGHAVVNAGWPGSSQARETMTGFQFVSSGPDEAAPHGTFPGMAQFGWADSHWAARLIEHFQPDKVVIHFLGNSWCTNGVDGGLEEFNTLRWQQLSIAGMLDVIDDCLSLMDGDDIVLVRGTQACFYGDCLASWSNAILSFGSWAISSLAFDRPTLHYVDFDDIPADDPTYRLWDQIHLTDAGASLMASRVHNVLTAGASPVVFIDPPASRSVTVGQILDGEIRRRHDHWRFDLYDRTGTSLGQVTALQDSTPEIHVKTGDQPARTLTGLTISATDMDEIDTVRHRIRAVYVLDDVDPPITLSFGLFLFGETPAHITSDRYRGIGGPAECSMNDQWQTLDSSRRGPFGITAGSPLTPILEALVEEGGVLATNIEWSPVGPGADMVWQPSENRRKIMGDIIDVLGYVAYFDNDGIFIARSAPDTGTAPATFLYGPDGAPFYAPDYTARDDAWKAPNVWEVISNGPNSASIWGTWELPPQAPHSGANRGYEIVETISAQGVPDQLHARIQAKAEALKNKAAFRYAEFDSAPDPRQDTYDVIEHLGVRYVQAEHSIKCQPGGPHHHVLAQAWDEFSVDA